MSETTVTYNHILSGSGKVVAPGDQKKIITGKFTFSSSYATGGEALDLSKQFRRLDFVKFEDFPTTATVNEVSYDYTNGKVLAYVSGTEIAAEVDLHTVSLRFVAIGLA